MITLLSGGTGTPKLLQGLMEIIDQSEISVVVNTAEDSWLPHGYFSPDIDTVLYTLCGIVDDALWHGIKGDSHQTHDRLLELGYDEILKIGDRDRAMHIQRGALMRSGKKLCEAVELQGQALGVNAKVYPMCDDSVQTVIVTEEGEMGLHEFLIARRGKPRVIDVRLEGIKNAKACEKAVRAIEKADGLIIGPSNPVSSILPIISLNEIRGAMKKRWPSCIAVSPIAGGKPFSGPTSVFMLAKGMEVSSKGLASLYADLASRIIVDEDDEAFEVKGVERIEGKIKMTSIEDKKKLAKLALKSLGQL